MSKTQPFPHSTPESQGIHSTRLLEFIHKLESIPSPNSVMLLRHGHVVCEGWWYPYQRELPHTLFSLTKSFTSTAVGLAEAEGLLSVDEKLVSIFPDDLPVKVSDNLSEMRIWHLLTMTTGHDQDATRKTIRRRDHNAARGFLSVPVKHLPGTHFVYNSGASQILSLIVQKRTGQSLSQYLEPRLFAPLGIEVSEWESYEDGTNFGGWGLSMKTEDIARFGQLYLQDGVWQGTRLLPEGWVGRATSKQVENGTDPKNGWSQGYGFQFWRCRGSIYRGDGAHGQFCFVMPDQDAVLAITSGVGDMQAVMDLVQDILLPAMGDQPVPEDLTAQQALQDKTGSLILQPLSSSAQSPRVEKLIGKRYRFDKNHKGMKWVVFELDDTGWKISFQDRYGRHSLEGNYTGWSEIEDGGHQLAVSGRWTTEDVLELQVCYYLTPFITSYKFQFDRNHVLCEVVDNVSFEERIRPAFVGRSDPV